MLGQTLKRAILEASPVLFRFIYTSAEDEKYYLTRLYPTTGYEALDALTFFEKNGIKIPPDIIARCGWIHTREIRENWHALTGVHTSDELILAAYSGATDRMNRYEPDKAVLIANVRKLYADLKRFME